MRLYKLFATLLISILLLCKVFGQGSEDFEFAPCESCHRDSEHEVKQSVHGMEFLLSKGVPSQEAERIRDCLTCHNKHGKDDPEASNFPIERGRDIALCGSCHAPELAYYFVSYHGRHIALKKSNSPTCTYCHVGHERPLTDPQSFLHSGNVGRICAGCHGGSEDDKTVMAANLSTPSTGATLYGRDVYKLSLPIKLFYSLIGLLFFGFVLTCAIELVRGGESDTSKPFTPKLDKSLKTQILFFIALYILMDSSGTALLYSYDYGTPISFLMSKISLISMKIYGSDDARSLIHRLAALMLSMLVLFHLGYLFKNREFVKRMRFRIVDLKMAWQEIRFKVKGYTQENYLWKRKVAYWSVLFLLAIMIVTGWVQWLAFSILKFSQLQVIRYARLIHDWNGLFLSMTLYGIIILYFGLLRPLAKRRK